MRNATRTAGQANGADLPQHDVFLVHPGVASHLLNGLLEYAAGWQRGEGRGYIAWGHGSAVSWLGWELKETMSDVQPGFEFLHLVLRLF